MSDETKAVAERYARRHAGDLYHPLQPAVWRERQGRQRALIDLLKRHAPRPVGELEVLEVGCGHGDNLLELLTLGFHPARLVGNELLPARAAAARERLPAVTALHEGDALALPFEPGSFDIVLQSTVFSSLLDDGFQQRLAERMWAWVRPGGAVLWYDFTWNNPRNPDVRGVPPARIRALFPRAQIDVRRVTLAPPLARAVGRWPSPVHGTLHALPPLRTHLLAWLGKR
jgi:SAM-dependent methyltransferase